MAVRLKVNNLFKGIPLEALYFDRRHPQVTPQSPEPSSQGRKETGEEGGVTGRNGGGNTELSYRIYWSRSFTLTRYDRLGALVALCCYQW